jgi:hypothetical protein
VSALPSTLFDMPDPHAESVVPELVTAALRAPNGHELLARAAAVAVTTRDRQLVAIASAHLRGEGDVVDALAREHLVDHPDSVLVARIAAANKQTSTQNKETS